MSRIVHLALNAADHLVSKGRLDAAASILQNYLSTNRPDPQVLQRLGRVYLAQGRSAEAVPLLQQALQQFSQPDNHPAHEADVDPAATHTDLDNRFVANH